MDALIGNWDRHNGNWGFLYDTAADTLQLAPVYDCGSSLYPQADDKLIGTILANKKEQDYRVFEMPMSAIKMDGKKIKYYQFISSLSNADCNAALERIMPRIDMKKIDQIVDETPMISDLQKDFYKTMLHKRKELILDHSLELLQQRECKEKTVKIKKASKQGQER